MSAHRDRDLALGRQYQERNRGIARRYAGGEKQRELAREFGLSVQHISLITKLVNREESNKIADESRHATAEAMRLATDGYFRFCLLSIIEAPATPASPDSPAS